MHGCLLMGDTAIAGDASVHRRTSAFASQTRKPMQGLSALVGERHAFRNPDSRIGGKFSP